MPACKVCGHWFVKIKPQEELCDKCESALYRLSGYVVQVVHGRWEKQSGLYSCSECGKTCPYDVQADVIEYWACNYCPHCGAKNVWRSGQ